ncbi:MAG: hypothetical protein LBS84_11900 [Clostridiales bacterium]|jgi:predicted nucleotidyltransferase|nr:hypothetical protein [Clostridiales bacterium]
MPENFALNLFTRYCEVCNQIEDQLSNVYQRKVDIVHFENDSLVSLFDDNVEKEVLWV